MSFTNNGDVGHNAIIRDVSVTMTVTKRPIKENWLSFVTVSREEVTKLKLDIKEPAHPVVVSGGGASSYMISFSPQVTDCSAEDVGSGTCNQAADFVSDTQFLDLLSPLGQTEFVSIVLGPDIFQHKALLGR